MSAATTRYDTARIKAANSPEAVMTRLSLAPSGRGRRLKTLCPNCGKRDKFDVDRNSGAFNCFTCDLQGGDVIGLVMAVLSLDFSGACDWLGGAQDLSAEDRQRLADEQTERAWLARIEGDRKTAADREQMQAVIKGLRPGAGTPVQTYLEGRGLGPGLRALGWLDAKDRDTGGWPKDISFHPALDLWVGPKGARVKIGQRPAMVMLGRDAHGGIVCLHRTYLEGRVGGPVTKVAGTVSIDGIAIPIEAKQVLGPVGRATRGVYLGATDGIPDDSRACSLLAEGMENALAVAACGVAGDYYAALNLGRMVGRISRDAGSSDTGFEFPQDGRPRLLLADNDLSPTLAFPDFKPGEAPEVTGDDRFGGVRRVQSQMAKAQARLRANGDSVGVTFPPRGMDFNDWLLAQ